MSPFIIAFVDVLIVFLSQKDVGFVSLVVSTYPVPNFGGEFASLRHRPTSLANIARSTQQNMATPMATFSARCFALSSEIFEWRTTIGQNVNSS
jgi:hypothetical protein